MILQKIRFGFESRYDGFRSLGFSGKSLIGLVDQLQLVRIRIAEDPALIQVRI